VICLKQISASKRGGGRSTEEEMGRSGINVPLAYITFFQKQLYSENLEQKKRRQNCIM